MDLHIFTELVGIQMLLMNTLEPLLRAKTCPGTAHRPFSPGPNDQDREAQKPSESAARTRRNSHARRTAVGRRESIIWPPANIFTPSADLSRARCD